MPLGVRSEFSPDALEWSSHDVTVNIEPTRVALVPAGRGPAFAIEGSAPVEVVLFLKASGGSVVPERHRARASVIASAFAREFNAKVGADVLPLHSTGAIHQHGAPFAAPVLVPLCA